MYLIEYHLASESNLKSIGDCEYFSAGNFYKCKKIVDVLVPSKTMLKSDKQRFSDLLKTCVEKSIATAVSLRSNSVAFLQFSGLSSHVTRIFLNHH